MQKFYFNFRFSFRRVKCCYAFLILEKGKDDLE